VFVGSDSAVAEVLATALPKAGAHPHVVGELTRFESPGEAYGRPPLPLDPEGSERFEAMVFDATTLQGAADLRRLYEFFHPIVRRLRSSGRIAVIGRPVAESKTAEEAAARAALEGFVRSLAKEVGRVGATAQLLTVSTGAESGLPGPLRFFLTERGAYVSGQSLHISGEATDSSWVRPLEGKVALVTGAARGIGAATSRLLAAEGATVVCLDRPADDGPTSKLAREIEGGLLLVDVTDADAPQRISSALKERYGGVDIVVHNAGITRDKTLARMDAARWDQIMSVNLEAVTEITSRLLSDKVLRPQGRVICLSSIAGIAGNLGQTNYAASKAAIIGFVECLATQTVAQGITVNAIAPGFIETRLTAAIPIAIREVARRMNNLSQGGRPDDVGQAILFLATPGAQGVNGQTLRVCGGSLVGR
jgi:3-oxoacyl-[acyl-carrier protein] reductase